MKIFLQKAKKAMVLGLGVIVLLFGIMLLVLPGPAILVIPAGLAIIGTQSPWMRDLIKKSKDRLKKF